jgi:hypothetical protein
MILACHTLVESGEADVQLHEARHPTAYGL